APLAFDPLFVAACATAASAWGVAPHHEGRAEVVNRPVVNPRHRMIRAGRRRPTNDAAGAADVETRGSRASPASDDQQKEPCGRQETNQHIKPTVGFHRKALLCDLTRRTALGKPGPAPRRTDAAVR